MLSEGQSPLAATVPPPTSAPESAARHPPASAFNLSPQLPAWVGLLPQGQREALHNHNHHYNLAMQVRSFTTKALSRASLASLPFQSRLSLAFQWPMRW